jgi:anti-sigma factor RsiW
MVSCKKLAQNLSGYIEGDVDNELRSEIERHLSHCRRCSVLLDSVRKVLVISGDEHTFEILIGYEERLHSFLDSHI